MKRYEQLLIIVSLTLWEIPAQMFAANWTSSGNYSISWYNKSRSEFIISTNKELAGVAFLVNNGYTTFKGCTIKLGDDINLSGND